MNNICHFVFGMKKQTEEFLFSFYIAVYSAYLINNPDIIFSELNNVSLFENKKALIINRATDKFFSIIMMRYKM